ncbi:Metallo-dependent hydrolase [Gymnopus androsaceus JB14]|uniref:Metallo-dependent hydrolase n=1 Tax=Gymnopus androsaceus JB14 TaxID=1447944 RepID=A0A6A4IAE0_9AGAR|nr:Metallo-dependent hydrolase [Gymnopus androsaceus JB14]
MLSLPSPDVLRNVVDAHCHPTDAPSISSESMDKLSINICAMSSKASDQSMVRKLAQSYPDKVIPCFGYHPWFSHLISIRGDLSKEDHFRELFRPSSAEDLAELNALLPGLSDPIPLDNVLQEVRQNLEAFPNAMLGEVGLDRSFRIPYDYDASPHLAVALGRNISLHSVKAHQATMELLASSKAKHGVQWNKISLDMHSCGFSPEMWKDIERRYSNVFISLSTVINSRSPNHIALIKACDPHRILVESDYNDVDLCAQRTWEMVSTVAHVKNWKIETEWREEGDHTAVVHRLKENWIRFKEGNHPTTPSRGKS